MHVYRAATYTALSFDIVSFITQRLAGPVLDSKYAKTIADVDALRTQSSAGKVAHKDLKSSEVKEMELLRYSVDESQFGNALVDTILL